MVKKVELGTKNIIIAALVAGFVFIVAVLFFLNTTYNNAKHEVFVSIHEDETQNVFMLKHDFETNKNFVLSISINLGRLTGDINSAEAIRYLREQNLLTYFSVLYVINKEGNMSFGGKSSKTQRNYYISLLSMNDLYTEVKILDSEKGKYLTINSPVIHNNEVIGILSARIYSYRLNQLITFDTFNGEGHSYLLSKNGSIMASSNNLSVNKDAKTIQELFLSGSGGNDSKEYFSAILDGMEKGTSGEMIYPMKGGNRIVSFMPLGVSDMYLLTAVPERVVFASAYKIFFKGIVFVVISMAIFAAFMYYFFIAMKKRSEVINKTNKELYLSKEQFDVVKKLTKVIFFEWDIATGMASHSSSYLDFFNPLESYENFPYSIEDDKTFSPEDAKNIIIFFEELKKGLKEGSIEVRPVNKFGKPVWFKVSMSTIFDESGKAIKVVGILSDIDEQKQKLCSAEESAKRDPLTHLCNKTYTRNLIETQIETTYSEGAFLMIDIDNFKGVNDSLGHLYGDAVLSELARALRSLFRDSDIVGRIGGDEFVVFMGGAKDLKVVQNKTDMILKVFKRSCHREGTKHNISCSIGISLYPQDGNSYDELMQKADRALYYSKSLGKNRCTLYSDIPEAESSFEYQNTREVTEIGEVNGIAQKNFRENIAEYILKLFYQYEDVDVAVPILLNFVGESFGVGRTDVSVFSEDDTYYEVLYEWCDAGVNPIINEGKRFPADEWSLIKPHLDENNILLCTDVEKEVPSYLENDDMAKRGVKSLMICYAIDKGKRRAVLCFEYFDAVHAFTKEEMDAIKTISNTISLFVLRAREKAAYLESSAKMQNQEMMLDELDEIVYVSDAENYDLLYVNKAGRDLLKNKKTDYKGSKCYRYLFKSKKPCPFCTMHLLSRDKYYVWERTLKSSGQHYMLKDKLLDWNGREARIELAINLTEKQKQQKNLASRLEIEKELLESVGEMVYASNLEESLSLILKRVGHLYNADRSYMMRINEDGKTISMTNEWLSEGIAPEIGNLQNFDFSKSPLWFRAFTMQEPVVVADISEFKESYPEEYERLAVQGIQNMFATPITIKGKFWGFVGVDSPRKYIGEMHVLESVAYFVADEINKRNIII
ncbi:MAG: diguanylate cyclase [Synergistaceae bacterium]|nr:diguanylate cyclase [Synergistaceae bacterium]